jgi:hypothetical protein
MRLDDKKMKTKPCEGNSNVVGIVPASHKRDKLIYKRLKIYVNF